MKRYVKSSSKVKYAIAVIDDKTGDILGYVNSYSRGGYYHPGDVLRATYDPGQPHTRTWTEEKKAQLVLKQYGQYSEVYMYDPTSNEYPMPSEKWVRKRVPTHLEVVEI